MWQCYHGDQDEKPRFEQLGIRRIRARRRWMRNYEWLIRHVFFFQAEDGIRDLTVTGVQTCALPISPSARVSSGAWRRRSGRSSSSTSTAPSWRTPCSARAASARSSAFPFSSRGGGSGERRGGKEGRSRWAPDH